MSFVDHTQAFSVPYTPEDTFQALKKALNKLSEFKVDKVDENLKTIYAKAGVSLFSWGENITISVGKSSDGTAEVSLLSTPKTGAMFGGAMDMGKNRRNLGLISDALSKELQNCKKVEVGSNTGTSVADEIQKLADLKEKGFLSEEEFEAKKKQLLGL